MDQSNHKRDRSFLAAQVRLDSTAPILNVTLDCKQIRVFAKGLFKHAVVWLGCVLVDTSEPPDRAENMKIHVICYIGDFSQRQNRLIDIYSRLSITSLAHSYSISQYQTKSFERRGSLNHNGPEKSEDMGPTRSSTRDMEYGLRGSSKTSRGMDDGL